MMDLESGGTTKPSGSNRYTWVYSELSSVAQFMVEHAVALIAGGKEIHQSHDAAGAGDEIQLATVRRPSSEVSDSIQAVSTAVEPSERILRNTHDRTHGDVNRAEQETVVPSEESTDQVSTRGLEEPDAIYEGADGRALLVAYKTGKFKDGLATVVPVNRPSTVWAQAKIKGDGKKQSTYSKAQLLKLTPEMVEDLKVRKYARSEEDIWTAIVDAWGTIRPHWHNLVPFWRVKAIQETKVRNTSVYQAVTDTLINTRKLHVSEYKNELLEVEILDPPKIQELENNLREHLEDIKDLTITAV